MRKTLSFAAICRGVANLTGVLTAFISLRLYNLYVSKEIYGTILVGLQLIGYLQLMSGGFRMALNQQMLAEPDEGKTQGIARFGQTLQSYFFIIVVLGGMGAMAIYSQFPHTRAMGISILVFIATGLAAAITFQAGSQLALLVAFGEQAASAIIQGLWGALATLVLWISFSLGSGVWAFPLSSGISAVLVILIVRVALNLTRNDVPLFVWKRQSDFLLRLKSVWRHALDCLFNQGATALVFTIDIVLIGLIIGPGAAAIYGVVARVMAISRLVLQSLAEAMWPRLAEETNPERRAQIMRKVDRLNAWVVGSWYGAMVLTLIPLLGCIVPSWVATPVLATLIIARSFITNVVSPHAYGLLGAGRFRDLARVNMQEVVIGSILGTLLCWRMGVNGVAIAFLVATAVSSGWLMTRRYFQEAHDTHWLSELFAVYSRAILAGAVSLGVTAVLWPVTARLGSSGWLAIPVGAIAFAVPAGAVLLAWRGLGRIP